MGKTQVQVPPDLMSYQEAADALGMTLGSVRTAVHERRLRPVKLPGHVNKYIRRQDLDVYREHRRVDYAGQEKTREQATTDVAAPISPAEMQAYAQALAAPMESLARNTAQAAIREAVPGMIVMVLGGLQIQRGQQPTLDPKALAV